MRKIGITDLGVLVLLVVVRCRQAQAALEGVGNLALRILEIGFRAEVEKAAQAARVAVTQIGNDIGRGLQRIDLRQFRLVRQNGHSYKR